MHLHPRPGFTRSLALGCYFRNKLLSAFTVLILIVACVPATSAAGAPRDYPLQRHTLKAPMGLQAMMDLQQDDPSGIVVWDISVPDNTPEGMVAALLGSDSTIRVSNVTYTGASNAAGRFYGGTGIVGFEEGIVLSTGNIRSLVGPNAFEAVTTENGQPGDDDLSFDTYDAAALAFDFVPHGAAISFKYVFSSDEYNEFANSEFNDMFAIIVNGENMALVPNTALPVSINTINGGNPIGEDPQNPQYFINNDDTRINTEMDGLTVVLTMRADVTPDQVNHMKIVIADVADERYDSNVLIKAGSLTDSNIIPPDAPPETSAVPVPLPNSHGWNRTPVDVMLYATTPMIDNSIKEIHYQIGDEEEVVEFGAEAIASLFVEGTTILTYYAIDSAGITESPKTLAVNIDRTRPTIAPVYKKANAAGWYNTDVPVNFDCRDALSDIDQCLGNAIVREGANQTVKGTAIDMAGNVREVTTPAINVDKTKPTITGAPDRPANSDGWYNASVTVSFTCTDGLSGIVDCPSSILLDRAGRGLSASGATSDRAGNSSSTTVSGINIDMEDPVTTASATTDESSGAVTITFAATDNLSGIHATYYAVDGGSTKTGASVTLAAGGEHTITYWSVDKAGNAEDRKTVAVQTDSAPPTIAHTQTPAPNAGGWNNTDVTVTFTCKDDAGIASCTGDTTLTEEGKAQVVTGTATDIAGNTATDRVTLNIDKTAPVVKYAGQAETYTLGQQIKITCSATDALSGVASADCNPVNGPAYDFDIGENSFTATATDKAGNEGTATVTFTVVATYEGFCSLIDELVPQHGVANSLCVKIRNAQKAEEKGNIKTRNNILDAFVQEVEAQTGKWITPQNAQKLLRMAEYFRGTKPVPGDPGNGGN